MPETVSYPHIYDDILELITDTPLVEITRLEVEPRRARVFAKLESQNPGGSVKDRICYSMLLAAEASGALKPSGVVVEPTSGNTGIGLALVAARRGYRCILTMPESMSLERRQLLESMGAELVLTPEEQQMEGAILRARAIVAETPGAFMPQQFDNPANPRAHYESTAQEIIHALGELTPSAFVAAVGTGGTLTGAGRALKERYPDCRVIGVEPEACATLSRGERGPSKIQGIAAGFVPGNYDPRVPTEIRTVTDQRAYEVKRALGRREGLLVGISSGANVAASLEVARELAPEQVVVTVLCDTGERYFSLDEYFDA